jgi:hypothetical protein
VAPVAAALAVVAAALLAAFGDGFAHPSGEAATVRPAVAAEPEPEPAEEDPAPEAPTEDDLPPDHPPIDQAAMGRRSEPPSIAWTVPADWKQAPNPNTFRIATFRTPGGAELSVSSAGGSIEANIDRWVSQFVDAGAPRRQTKTVHGLPVTTVEIAGMYEAASMGGGADEAPSIADQALVAAIVTAPDSPYFFKLLGSARAVAAARPSFDRLVASIAPR